MLHKKSYCKRLCGTKIISENNDDQRKQQKYDGMLVAGWGSIAVKHKEYFCSKEKYARSMFQNI